jgi:hydroxypyruvate isomerase
MPAMLRFCPNLSTLFTDRPLLQRFGAARAAGFEAVELQFPYAETAEAIAAELRAHGLTLQLINLPAGDWAAGERGLACHPGREAEFRDSVAQALHYARELSVPRLHCLAGLRPKGVSAAQARETFLHNLRFAARAFAAEGRTLMLEPINNRDMPAYALNTVDEAVALIEALAEPNLKLQYDLYHQQRMRGELIGTLRQHLPHIAHLQIADNPGRAEPGTGEIAWANVFAAIEASGYGGWVGLEYFPSDQGPRGTEAGLAWLAALGRHANGDKQADEPRRAAQ